MTTRGRWTLVAVIGTVAVIGFMLTRVNIRFDNGAEVQTASLPQVLGSALASSSRPSRTPPNSSGELPPPPVLKSSAPIVRTFAPESAWKRLWVVGSDSTSDTWVEPRQLVLNGDMVVVLDDGTREVRGLDTRTGATRMLLLPRGQGPGEFKRPSLLANTPSGFAILDQANGRITAFDRVGKLEWDAVFTDAINVRGLCISDGPRVMTYHNRRDSALVEYDSTGRRTAVRSIPWATSDTAAEGFAYTSYISDVGASGSCVLAPLFGARWGVIAPTGPVRMFALKEPGASATTLTTTRILDRSNGKITFVQPETSESPQSSRGALIHGDTAIVYAAHTKQYRLQILDYYSLRTGAYLYSRRLPGVLNALTIGDDGTFYATAITNSAQVVVAMKPTRVAEQGAKTGEQKPR